jgi:acetyl esterase/lipase
MLLPWLMALAAPIRSRAARGLSYGPGARQTIEVHAPVGADGEAPVVVMFKPCDRHAGPILAAHGLVVVVVAGVDADWSRPGALEDAARACAWAREQAPAYGGDPRRLFVFGHAEGGAVAARLALEPRWLAAVGLEGVLRGAVGVLGLYERAGDETAPPVGPHAPPMLLLAGGAGDCSTGRLAERLRTAGAEVSELRVPGLEPPPLHRLAVALRQRLMALDEIERFIRVHSLEFGV